MATDTWRERLLGGTLRALEKFLYGCIPAVGHSDFPLE